MSVNKISGPKLSRPAFAIDVNVKNLMLQMFLLWSMFEYIRNS